MTTSDFPELPPGWERYKLYFDRDGREIDLDEWSDLRMRGEVYVRVALTDIGHAGEGIRVSTVWTGLNAALFPDSRPLMFQTAVFGGPLDGTTVDYPNEREAQQGHDAMVGQVMKMLGPIMGG